MKVIIRNLQKKIPIRPKKIKEAILKTLSSEGARKSGQISVSFVNDKKINELNLRYLRKNNPTDVLAFDSTEAQDKDNIFADIVISTDTAVTNAKVFMTTPTSELYLYVIHAMLHLLGYDDKTPKQRKIMEERASRILKYVHP